MRTTTRMNLKVQVRPYYCHYKRSHEITVKGARNNNVTNIIQLANNNIVPMRVARTFKNM